MESSAMQELKISTHALREEGDPYSGHVKSIAKISTHALREEGDVLNRL